MRSGNGVCRGGDHVKITVREPRRHDRQASPCARHGLTGPVRRIRRPWSEPLTGEIDSRIIDSMSVEWSMSVRERARVHAALGEPARLAIVDRLVLGDASPTEIGRELGLPSNLLAHHLTVLEQAGMIERSRSEGDHRRMYLRLRPEPLAGLLPAGLH